MSLRMPSQSISCLCVKRSDPGTEGMARQLIVPTALAEDLSLVPAPMLGSSQLSVTPASEDPTPSSGLHGNLCTYGIYSPIHRKINLFVEVDSKWKG